MIDEQDDDADDGDAHHVLVEENIDGVWVVSIWTVVEGKLLNQKKDHCDHKLSEGTIMVITMTDENGDLDDFLCKEWQAVHYAAIHWNWGVQNF